MIDEILKTIYDDNSEHVVKRYDEFIDEAIRCFKHEVCLENIKNKVLKILKEKYPQYTYRWSYMGDGSGQILYAYNVDEKNMETFNRRMYDILDPENKEHEFDLLCDTVSKENTKEYYLEMLKKVNNNEK